MGLDLSPSLERDLGQQPTQTLGGDPVASLSRQSGISVEALSNMSPRDRDGLVELEAVVGRALHESGQPGSGVTPEMAQAAVLSRNQIRDGLVGQGALNGVLLADARVSIRDDAPSASPPPPDARLNIRDQAITISSDVYIYGSGATQQIADTFERQIQQEWGTNNATGQPWTYTDPSTNRTYNVRFDVDVKVFDPDNPRNAPGVFSGPYTPWNRDNFIEVTADSGRSEVRGWDEGTWRAHGRNGKTLAADNPAAHEFGHLLGLDDRYVKSGPNEGQPMPGWSGNIMAMPANRGNVEQRDIDAIVSGSVGEYRRAGSPASFDTSIDP